MPGSRSSMNSMDCNRCSRSPIRRSSSSPRPTRRPSLPGWRTARWEGPGANPPVVFPPFAGALRMNNTDAALAEIAHAVNDLGARGVQLFTNVAGKPLSAPEFRPIFRRMAAHDLPVWLHPMRDPNFPDYASEQISEAEIWFSFGWPYETSACVTRLIYSRLFDELPAL